jgi:hypothetical protein
MDILSHPVQPFIALPLPILPGSADFVKYAELLNRMDRLLMESGVEAEFIARYLAKREKEAEGMLSASWRRRFTAIASLSLRCNLARSLTKMDFRTLSIHLADSHLLRRFCRLEGPDAPVRSPSKSNLQRMSVDASDADLQALIQRLTDMAARQKGGLAASGALAKAIRTDMVLMDSTCLELNIHFPTDWVLLRDACRSLLETIQTIRRHGLTYRISDPRELMRRVNRLAMQMTQAARRGKGDRRMRKEILRKLKKLTKVIQGHGQRYRDLLCEQWSSRTDLSEGQAKQLIRNLDNVLEKVPAALHQAHERIIGERPVKNDEKLLSLYESHARVYVRGKADAEVEFGLQLTFGEVACGLITYWTLGEPANDCTHLPRFIAHNGLLPTHMRATSLVTDRGFSSEANERLLAAAKVASLVCPRNPEELDRKLQDPKFVAGQRRRAQTEARVAILNGFIGEQLPARGLERQQLHVAWAVLTHNLWCLARLPERKEKKRQTPAA